LNRDPGGEGRRRGRRKNRTGGPRGRHWGRDPSPARGDISPTGERFEKEGKKSENICPEVKKRT